jgi:hypothetical protein
MTRWNEEERKRRFEEVSATKELYHSLIIVTNRKV